MGASIRYSWPWAIALVIAACGAAPPASPTPDAVVDRTPASSVRRVEGALWVVALPRGSKAGDRLAVLDPDPDAPPRGVVQLIAAPLNDAAPARVLFERPDSRFEGAAARRTAKPPSIGAGLAELIDGRALSVGADAGAEVGAVYVALDAAGQGVGRLEVVAVTADRAMVRPLGPPISDPAGLWAVKAEVADTQEEKPPAADGPSRLRVAIATSAGTDPAARVASALAAALAESARAWPSVEIVTMTRPAEVPADADAPAILDVSTGGAEADDPELVVWIPPCAAGACALRMGYPRPYVVGMVDGRPVYGFRPMGQPGWLTSPVDGRQAAAADTVLGMLALHLIAAGEGIDPGAAAAAAWFCDRALAAEAIDGPWRVGLRTARAELATTVRHWQRALEVVNEQMLDPDPATSRLGLLRRGTILNEMGRYEEALAVLTEVERGQRDVPAADQLMVGVPLGDALAGLNRFEAAAQRYTAAADQMPEGFTTARLDALHSAGRMYHRAERFEGVLDVMDRAQAIAPDRPFQQAGIAAKRGGALLSLGRTDEALEAFERRRALAEATGLHGWRAAALFDLAQVHLVRKDRAKTEALLREALPLSVGTPAVRAAVLGFLADYLRISAPDEAAGMYAEQAQLYAAQGDLAGQMRAEASHLALLARRQPKAAMALYPAYLERVEGLGDPRRLDLAQADYARLLDGQGELDAAAAVTRARLAAGLPDAERETLERALASIERRRGRWDVAVEILEGALERADQGPRAGRARRRLPIQVALAQALAARGGSGDAARTRRLLFEAERFARTSGRQSDQMLIDRTREAIEQASAGDGR